MKQFGDLGTEDCKYIDMETGKVLEIWGLETQTIYTHKHEWTSWRLGDWRPRRSIFMHE